MTTKPPKIVAIAHDDYTARSVGRTGDKRQFFLTQPFVPARGGSPGREFLALYIFDQAGVLVEAVIEDLGVRAEVEAEAAGAREAALLESLGEVEFCMITVAPFGVKRYGVEFGLVPRPPEEPEDDWAVIAEPGNYMCFWPPFTSGDYDT